jgi:hypothetical protein
MYYIISIGETSTSPDVRIDQLNVLERWDRRHLNAMNAAVAWKHTRSEMRPRA